ncbi:glycosyltransferase family 8 protein [Coprococcus comes]|uniref:glycosyltransferase family 8 protein n=1 Tax=Coprococcus comes TaxID=410072 RepID=UPI00156DA282|nr:glycosyltransferase family 8 protein [Coprococcus comes]NSE80319.1 glycosyltransferase family 8 protein [Coprococcus comes]NSE83162.1 glycosyltransferase family 8 protein [Coprococcus comes]NSF20827.1 glycosyltransferase family 8 protein [Coprococcus comes]
MKVMYTCDNNYVWLMGISVISLFENNKHVKELKVYLLGEKISKENKIELKKIGNKYNREIEIINVPKLNIPPSLVSTRWPTSAFTRLFSGVILPNNIDRILYLDCDTIIVGDISGLENVKFNGNIAMGVKDCISGTYKENIGLNKKSPYINAGVILFNMNALRKVDINIEIENYMNKYRKFINYADQDILNGIFKGKIGELDPKYDVMTIDVVYSYEEIQQLRRPTNFCTKEELYIAKNNPTIIHYTTNMRVVRPWFVNTDHPLADEFEKYIKMSIWKDKELKEAIFDSKEAKVIAIILKLPKGVAYRLLGVIHAELKPRYIRMRAKK